MEKEAEKMIIHYQDNLVLAYREFLDAIKEGLDKNIIRRGTTVCEALDHMADHIKHNRYAIYKGAHKIPYTEIPININAGYNAQLADAWHAYSIVSLVSKAKKHLKVIGPGSKNYNAWCHGDFLPQTSLSAIAISRSLPLESAKTLKITIRDNTHNSETKEDVSKAIDEVFIGWKLVLNQLVA